MMPGLTDQAIAQQGTVADIDTDVTAIRVITDALPNAGALTSISSETDKIDTAAAGGLTGTSNSVAYRVHEVERHFHNRGRFWGAVAVPDETNAIAATVSVPFVAISGNNTWGTAIPICGTSDDATDGLGVKHDPHLLLVVDTDHATAYRIRFIYGTGTSAAAIAAGQWSETMFITSGGPFSTGVPVEMLMRRIDVGAKLWCQVWNATNLSNVDFYWGTHPYEG